MSRTQIKSHRNAGTALYRRLRFQLWWARVDFLPCTTAVLDYSAGQISIVHRSSVRYIWRSLGRMSADTVGYDRYTWKRLSNNEKQHEAKRDQRKDPVDGNELKGQQFDLYRSWLGCSVCSSLSQVSKANACCIWSSVGCTIWILSARWSTQASLQYPPKPNSWFSARVCKCFPVDRANIIVWLKSAFVEHQNSEIFPREHLGTKPSQHQHYRTRSAGRPVSWSNPIIFSNQCLC